VGTFSASSGQNVNIPLSVHVIKVLKYKISVVTVHVAYLLLMFLYGNKLA